MRLFLAIEIGEAARRAVAAEQHRLRGTLADAGIRWVRPEHMHLTLVFLGEIDDARVPELVESMSGALRQPRFAIELGGAGVFPDHGPPRVLWLGVERGARETMDLQAEVAARAGAWAAPEPRPFHPHLTLGRWRGRSHGVRALRHLAASRVCRVAVDAVTLFHSRPSSAGPTYTALTQAYLT